MTRLVRFDWAIKYLLRNKANFDILEGFLSELLKEDIRITALLESEGNQDHAEAKFNRVDVMVETAKKERIIIEVQCVGQWDYLSRMLYGTSKVITEYLSAGDAYGNISKVISISIVFFNLGSGKDYIYKGQTEFIGIHDHDKLELGKAEQEHYGPTIVSAGDVFPDYYIIKVNQFRETLRDKFDEWMYFLKTASIKPEFTAKGLESAGEKLDVLRLNDKERRVYAKYQDSLHDDGSISHMVETGRKKGREEGRKEGREEGEKRGQTGLILKMREKGLNITEISQLTGLSEPQITELLG